MRYKKKEVEKSRRYLLDELKIIPGDTIYTRVNHVSRSGMTRYVSTYLIRKNEPLRLDYHVAVLLGYRSKNDVIIDDYTYEEGLVYNLSRELFLTKKGNGLKQRSF